MRTFFDLDDVIFDTRRFIEDLREGFRAAGIPADVFNECYRARKASLYSLEDHVVCMADRSANDTSSLSSVADGLFLKAPDYVFPDMRRVLEDHGERIEILSFGGKAFQERKIRASEIGKYVRDVHITEGPKTEILVQLCRAHEPLLFIDDRIHHLDAIKTRFPNAVTVLMQRPEGRYADEASTAADLRAAHGTDIAAILERYQ